MPISPFASGQHLTATLLNNAFDDVVRAVYQTADQTVNNTTTYLNSSSLVISNLAANTGYLLHSLIIYDSGTTPDFKVRFTMTGSGDDFLRLSPWGQITTATGTTNAVALNIIDDTADAVEVQLGGAGAGTPVSAMTSGLVAAGSSTSALQVAFAQVTANASNTSIKLGSWLKLTRVL